MKQAVKFCSVSMGLYIADEHGEAGQIFFAAISGKMNKDALQSVNL